MKATKNEEAAMWSCYRTLYKASDPPANFDDLMRDAPVNEHGQKVIDYMAYEISIDNYNEIVNETIKEFKIKPKYRADAFRQTMAFGATPKFKRDDETASL